MDLALLGRHHPAPDVQETQPGTACKPRGGDGKEFEMEDLPVHVDEDNVQRSPDCQHHKHAACNGVGFDYITDAPCKCPCFCHAEGAS